MIWNLSVVGQTNPPPDDDGTTLPLINAGATWRYFDEGSGVDPGWREPGFDDSQWDSGPAQLGYGDGDEATVVSFGPDPTQKHITTYFRRAFELAEAGQVARLDLRLLRDDGAVVYLNGQEVVRDNMPAGLVSPATLAAAANAEENDFHEIVVGPTFLVSGRNVVAVEVHQSNPASSDLGFDLALEAVMSGGDPLPVVSIAATTPETTEPSPIARVAPGVFTITREGTASEPLILFIELTGTAVLGQDYDGFPQLVTIPAGVTSQQILVSALDDPLIEGDESVVATISPTPPIDSLPNYRIDPQENQATIVIHDNEGPADLPVVSLTGLGPVLEFCPPNAICAPIILTLRRTGPGLDQPLAVFLHYGGTATPDVDYHSLATQVTFAAGQEQASVTGAPLDDLLFEGDETVVADLVAGVTYSADPQQRQVTTVIQDNEAPSPPIVSLTLVDSISTETHIDQNNIDWAEFGVVRTGPVTDGLIVYLNTAQGSARLGEDYRLERVDNGSSPVSPRRTDGPGASLPDRRRLL